MKGAYLGPTFSQQEIEQRLNAAGARFTSLTHDEMIAPCADALAAGEDLGWFHGRMEFVRSAPDPSWGVPGRRKCNPS
jgi:carbamoyltransferase